MKSWISRVSTSTDRPLAAESNVLLQRKPAARGSVNAVPSVVNEVVNTPGTSLDPSVRGPMEARFGHDFSRVRVHHDGKAAASAEAVQAHAYTVGEHVVFGHDRYQPNTEQGRKLLAHELTHTVQQKMAGPVAGGIESGRPGDPAEAEADRAAEQQGEHPGAASALTENAPILRREVADPSKEGSKTQTFDEWSEDNRGYYLPDHDGALKWNAEVAMGKKGKEGVGAEVIRQVQDYLGVGLSAPYGDNSVKAWSELLGPLTIAVGSWQHRYMKKHADAGGVTPGSAVNGIQMDGRLTPETVKALRAEGMAAIDWRARDRADAKAIREEEAFFQQRASFAPNSAGAKRMAIVDLARAQVGKVLTDDRGDGNKYGWERIARYYELAEAGVAGPGKGVATKPEDEQGPDAVFKRQRDADGVPTDDTFQNERSIAGIKKANSFAGDTTKRRAQASAEAVKAAEKKQGPLTQQRKDAIARGTHIDDWSWCGIFVLWAIRAITGKGTWASGPHGVGTRITATAAQGALLDNAQIGDLLHIKNSPQNHHVLLAMNVPPGSPPDTPIRVIEGNISHQQVAETTRWHVSDIDYYYSTV
ncbi:MAG: DUF4157 domain-containing protein [Myxococcaceae bacterium]|nr:DUF4157 domain-containing protein [Myxococcaceae bacterium]